MQHVEYQWRYCWFAKGPHTKAVDQEMKESFGWMLHDIDAAYFLRQTYRPTRLWETLALIILFDQIPRSVFRGTPAAYAYDAAALKLAVEIADDEDSIQSLAFCFQATVCICLCHAENLEIQDLLTRSVATVITKIPSSLHSESNPSLGHALRRIATHHRERIEWFGRFPERNAILGRISTAEEVALLQQLG